MTPPECLVELSFDVQVDSSSEVGVIRLAGWARLTSGMRWSGLQRGCVLVLSVCLLRWSKMILASLRGDEGKDPGNLRMSAKHVDEHLFTRAMNFMRDSSIFDGFPLRYRHISPGRPPDFIFCGRVFGYQG